jgi:hypothetical protein
MKDVVNTFPDTVLFLYYVLCSRFSLMHWFFSLSVHLYIQIVHRHSVRTSQGTQPLHGINIDLLMLFKGIISVYPDNFTTHLNTIPSHSWHFCGTFTRFRVMASPNGASGHTTRGRAPLDEWSQIHNGNKFKVCKSVHHRTIQINHQPDATVF